MFYLRKINAGFKDVYTSLITSPEILTHLMIDAKAFIHVLDSIDKVSDPLNKQPKHNTTELASKLILHNDTQVNNGWL